MALLERVRSTEVGGRLGRRVKVAGWLHARRALGGVTFWVVRDGWGSVQVTVDARDALPLCTPESVVMVEGDAVAEPKAPGGVELRNPSVQVLGSADALPFSLGKRDLRQAPATQLDHAALSLRHPARRAVFRTQSCLARAFRDSMERQGFLEIHSPKIVAGAAEGGAHVFALDYFDRPASLAQSPQLYKQMMVGVFQRVYEVGPVFRAEPHDTSRHLNQYTSLDGELGFIDDHCDVMALVERVVRDMVRAAQDVPDEERAAGARDALNTVRMPGPFPAVSFQEAKAVAGTGANEGDALDLSPQEEVALSEWARTTHGSDFLFVTGFPMSKRPFYTHPDSRDPRHSRSFDLLFRGLEVVTGGQRLHEYAAYEAALAARGMSPQPFRGYLEAFRCGMPPHGGFGMGLERMTMKLLGLANVREATLFPRTMNRLEP